jgi:hypothetical protein
VTRHLPAVAGLAGVVASVVVADVVAVRTDRPTISAAIGRALEHPVGGVAVVGVLAGLGWHLCIDPVVRRLERTATTRSNP